MQWEFGINGNVYTIGAFLNIIKNMFLHDESFKFSTGIRKKFLTFEENEIKM